MFGCAVLAAIETVGAAGLEITSPAFKNNASIPAKYTCEGQGVNPELVFTGVPAAAKSLALIVEDPDVPKDLMPSGVFDHWLIWDLPATTKGIKEGERKAEGLNGTGTSGYIGPCPPDRSHRYFFKVYALDTMLTGKKIANKDDLLAAMKGHIVQQAELVGTYDKQNK
jgi:hypothetical protein